MPLYQFQCGRCELIAEYLVKIGEEPEKCKHCGYDKLERFWHKQVFSFRNDSKRETSFGSPAGMQEIASFTAVLIIPLSKKYST